MAIYIYIAILHGSEIIMKPIKFTNFAQWRRYWRSPRFGKAIREAVIKNYRLELSKATKKGIARSKRLKREREGRLLVQRH